MQRRKILVLLLISILTFSAALAYSGSGDTDSSDSTPDTECNDDVDNDGDGKVDGDDSGCTKPYHEDDSEGNIYDLDASWIFSGNSAPSNSGPSVFYGWEVIEKGDTSSPYKDSSGSSGDEIVEQYVKDSDQAWGGGQVQDVTLDIADAETTDRDESGHYELFNAPYSGQCGDGIQDSRGKVSCPEDYGMADVLLSDSIDLPSGITGGQTDVYYDVEDSNDELKCQEITSDSRYPSSGEIDITSGDKTISLGSTSGESDYIVDKGALGSGNNDRILSVSCSDAGSTTDVISVTDYDRSKISITSVGSTTTAYTMHGSASSSESDYCESSNVETDYKTTLSTLYTSDSASPETVGVQPDATTGGAREDPTHDVTVHYKYNNNVYPDGGSSYDYCSSTTSYYDDCTQDSEMKSLGVTCSDVSETVYTVSSDEVYDDHSSNTHKIDYEDYDLSTSIWYDVSQESDAVGTVTDSDDSPYDNSNFQFSGGAFFTDNDSIENNFDQSNDPAVSRSAFKITVPSGTGGDFQATRDEYLTLDVDGPDGQGDGYVAADEESSGNRIVGSTPSFLSREVSGSSVTNDYVSTLNVPQINCDNPFTKCVASVDAYTKQTGWSSKTASAVGFDFVSGNPYSTNASLGTCKMYKSLSGDTGVNCQYDSDPDSPTNGGTTACGDEPNEYWAYMEGPEIDESVLEQNSGHYEACISDKSQCVLRGSVVNEGHVANVAPKFSNKQYEKGGNSPDLEVCLYNGGQTHTIGDDRPGDNKNNDINQEDYGGEWYDLDSEEAQQYLRNGGSNLVSSISSGQTKEGFTKDSNNDGTANESDIDYYWRQNLNPSDSTHNPEGGQEGTALEDDCGNTRFSSDNLNGCNDFEQRPSSGDTRQSTFYSFMTEGKRDEDHHPQGDNVAVDNAVFSGYINKLSDMSNQLESGMDTSNYYTSSTPDPDIWSNSDGSVDAADQWAITQNLNWSISSRGTPYPPWNTYYRDSSYRRLDPGSGSVVKTVKAFGNSYAAVADTSMTDDNGNTVDPGDGVWIDPDYIRTAWNSGDFRWDPDHTSWEDVINFRMDITGPDSGVGFDTGDGSGVRFKGSSGNQKAVVYADVYFQGEEDEIDNDGDRSTDEGPSSQNWEGTNQVGETVTQHEPPMCGDDQKEFLLEEMGESKRSEQFDGMYACANTSDPCVDMSSTPRIIDRGSYSQTNEADEDVGRLKNDVEFCEQRPQDDTSLWYDQDYGDIDGDGRQDTCRVNNIYGDRGVRWIDSDYVQNHPHTVIGGIDDDWNQYIEDNYNTGKSDEYTEKYTSKPDQNSWNFDSESPVPSGAKAVGNDSITTLGFCGGDDDGEYLVTQQCQTDLCETDRSIRGVTKTPGSCVLEPSTFTSGYSINTDERKLYAPGEEVEVNIGSESRTIACFNSNWYEDWPVVFNQNNVEVPFGESSVVGFNVINVREKRTTFEVEMIDPLTDDPSAYQHSTFLEKDGDSFETTVAPQSSKTFHVEIQGANKAIGDDSKPSEDDLTVRATAVNSDMSGQDYTTVEVVNNTATNSSIGRSEPQSVPGIGPVHIIVLIMISSAVFFLQS